MALPTSGGFPARFLKDGDLDDTKFSTRRLKYTDERFDARPAFSISTGNGAATGSTGNLNQIRTQYGVYEQHIKGTQTIIVPVFDATTGLGLNIAQDQTTSDGSEIVFGTNIVTSGGSRSKHGFVVGTDKDFFAELQFKPADTSGLDTFAFGFRKMQAYSTANDYDDFAVIDTNNASTSAKIQIKTNLANAGVGTTDTTQTALDTLIQTYRVEVSIGGVVRFLVGTGTASVAPTYTAFPTVTKTNFTFAAATVVVPYLFFLQASDLCDTLYLQRFKCGYKTPKGV